MVVNSAFSMLGTLKGVPCISVEIKVHSLTI